jgi:hypothetical protein
LANHVFPGFSHCIVPGSKLLAQTYSICFIVFKNKFPVGHSGTHCASNPSSKEVKVGGLASSRPVWATERIRGKPGLYSETLTQKTISKQTNKIKKRFQFNQNVLLLPSQSYIWNPQARKLSRVIVILPLFFTCLLKTNQM